MGYKTVLKTTKTGPKDIRSNFVKSKTLTSAIKKVIHKEAETKSLVTNDDYTLYNDYIYATNLNYKLSQGTDDQKIIGEKFFLKNIHLKGEVVSTNGASGDGNLSVRMMIIKTKEALTNTTTAITGTSIFRGVVDYAASQGMVDLYKVELVKDIFFNISQTNITTIPTSKSFDIKVPINKNLFIDFTTGYLKTGNYYLVTTVHKPNYIAANAGVLRCQYTVNFKDI